MNRLSTFKRFVFPSLVGLVLSTTVFSFSPLHLLSTVYSTNEDTVLVSPKSHSAEPSPSPKKITKEKEVGEKDNVPSVTSKPQVKSTSPTQANKTQENSPTTPPSKPAQTVKVTVDAKGTVTAKTTIIDNEKTIHLIMKYPKDGGKVTGTISGDCRGTVSGTYTPTGEGSFKGSAKATCPEKFIPIPVTLTFNAQFTPEDTQTTIYYSASALDVTRKGSTTLLLTS